MISEGLIWLLSLGNSMFLIFLAVYFLITLSDLECDYLNATTCCSRLNRFILVEVLLTCANPLLMALNFHWIKLVIHLPLALYLTNRYLSKSAGQIGIYDPTEIHNRGLLKGFMKESMWKVGYHVVFFLVNMYSTIYYMVM